MFKAKDVGKKHLERKQPTARKRLGLLEKKKDYQKRAQDYHKKQAHLALLRSKAAAHNEDEFDFGMVRGRTRDGVRVKERATAQVLSADAVKLMKTQDDGYIRTLEQRERRNVERAKESLVLESEGKHTVFVSDAGRLRDFDALKQQRQRASQPRAPLPADVEQERLSGLKELKQRVDRQRELSVLRQEVELQRELMKKGPSIRQVDAAGRVSYRWKQVRKR